MDTLTKKNRTGSGLSYEHQFVRSKGIHRMQTLSGTTGRSNSTNRLRG
jgi:hypothetical protein